MFRRTIWTERRLTGLILILGAVLFLVGAFLPLTDTRGNFIYSLPPKPWLGVVFAHPLLWQWANILFIGGVVATILGLVLLTRELQEAGDRMFSLFGFLLSLFGGGLWVIELAFRLSVDLWATQEMARTAVLPDFYVPLTLWTHALFVVYTVLAFLAFVAYGGSLLSVRVLPRWMGWLTLFYSLAGLGLFAYAHGVPPFLHYLMPGVLGILLLLRQSQFSPERARKERQAALSMTLAGEQRPDTVKRSEVSS